jgi:hypothetical protein
VVEYLSGIPMRFNSSANGNLSDFVIIMRSKYKFFHTQVVSNGYCFFGFKDGNFFVKYSNLKG